MKKKKIRRQLEQSEMIGHGLKTMIATLKQSNERLTEQLQAASGSNMRLSEEYHREKKLAIYLDAKLTESEQLIGDFRKALAEKIEEIKALRWCNEQQARVIEYYGLTVFMGNAKTTSRDLPTPLLDLVEKMKASGKRKREAMKARDRKIYSLMDEIIRLRKQVSDLELSKNN